jgi:SAM-dependent methyltransferase
MNDPSHSPRIRRYAACDADEQIMNPVGSGAPRIPLAQDKDRTPKVGGVSSGCFDQAYYQRYYFNARTAVISRAEVRARARLIGAFAAHIGLPVRRILDAGCGTGAMRALLLRSLPRATYVGLEASEYLCRRYGWEQGLIENYRAVPMFDLVVCYDVLQYLEDARAAAAIANLARLCRGLLYFTVLTRQDWRENCDRRRTDGNVHLRTGAWYRARLRRLFREIGAGFWLARSAPLAIWELETTGR